MSIEYRAFSSLSDTHKDDIALKLSDYTKGRLGEKPQMLPVEPIDIKNRYLGFIALDDCDFAGYIGAMQPFVHNGIEMPEVGSLWVPEQHRKKGIAHGLIDVISLALVVKELRPYAFCNPASKGIFAQMGYRDASPTEVPEAAFGLCHSCPNKIYPDKCCDEVVVYERIE